MPMLLGGLLVSASGLGLLLAMVARALEPGLLLSLLGFCAAFAGTLMMIGGIIRIASRGPRRF
ncbi:hypothetical protein J2T57_003633 [Natronocella acetinitrilica]|uniref:Uncharacterized protein n=1 Tax=Natronocella acetinitrilica TaxID=414046 RepID=A0AAE3G6S6_9GAMM|nr:hypothetical protein [Natronocella acetinitrilica]MCP1676472.1 hypothetical protein [Natronocella acetinitrilica]